jgi:HD-GYP domain-containing protein (c-di-GMP phosphodiesterase class II)
MRLHRSVPLLVLAAGAVPAAIALALLARRAEGPSALALAAVAAPLAAGSLLAWAVARSLTRPLRDVVQGALEIARGRFGSEVGVVGKNEIADLAYTFNYMSRELASYDGENRRLIAALGRGYVDTLCSLAGAIDEKDPYTRGHAERVAALAVEIGLELGLDADALRALEYGGILHDVGKIGVPDAILSKRTPLTDEERALLRAHPLIGAEIVAGVAFLAAALPAIRSHHERWDGAGYPDRLAGEAIPLPARIVNAADTWDACTSTRPYQAAIAPGDVLSILAGLRGTQLDPAVHDALVAVLTRRGVLGTPAPLASTQG